MGNPLNEEIDKLKERIGKLEEELEEEKDKGGKKAIEVIEAINDFCLDCPFRHETNRCFECVLSPYKELP